MTTYTIRTTIDQEPLTVQAHHYDWDYDTISFSDESGNEIAVFTKGVVTYILVTQ